MYNLLKIFYCRNILGVVMMALILKMLKTVKVLSNMTNSQLSFLFRSLSTVMLTGALVFLCTGCYRMPSDDDYSLVPTTNNPDVTRDRGGGLVPGGSF